MKLGTWIGSNVYNMHTQHLGGNLEDQGHSMTLKQNRVRPITSLFEVRFKNISQKWSPYWDNVLRARFGLLPWRSRSQYDLTAKSCLSHNLVIWSLILQHRNDHHVERMCCEQHLGRYLEGQGYSMTLQQNRVRPITLLFEVPFKQKWSPFWDTLSQAPLDWWCVTTLPIVWLCAYYTALY